MSQTLIAEAKPREDEEAKTEAVTLMEADATLTGIADDFSRRPSEAVTVIMQQGRPALAVLPWGYYESLMETLEVMRDEEAMAAIREYDRKVKNGEEIKTYDWEDIKKQHGL